VANGEWQVAVQIPILIGGVLSTSGSNRSWIFGLEPHGRSFVSMSRMHCHRIKLFAIHLTHDLAGLPSQVSATSRRAPSALLAELPVSAPMARAGMVIRKLPGPSQMAGSARFARRRIPRRTRLSLTRLGCGGILHSFSLGCCATRATRATYYCMKVFQARFHPRYKLSTLPSALGSDKELHDRFMTLMNFCISKVKEAGDRSVRIKWPSESQLISLQEDIMIWEDPDDLYIPYDDYVAKHGSPTENGKGHSTGYNNRNELCVIVPESNIMKRKRQRVTKVRYDAYDA